MYNDIIDQAFLDYLQNAKKPQTQSIKKESENKSIHKTSISNRLNLESEYNRIITKSPIQKVKKTIREISYEHLNQKEKLKSKVQTEKNMIKQKSEVLIRQTTREKAKKSEEGFDEFYQKNLHWKMQKEVQIKRVQKEFKEKELEKCTFSPQIIPKKIKTMEQNFISFSKRASFQVELPVKFYTEKYLKREKLRKDSPIVGQRSYRKICEPVKVKFGYENRPKDKNSNTNSQKYQTSISELKNFLHNMEF